MQDYNQIQMCPCKGCTEETGRHIGCHSECERYNSWNGLRLAEKKRVADLIQQQKMLDDDKLIRVMHTRHVLRSGRYR